MNNYIQKNTSNQEYDYRDYFGEDFSSETILSRVNELFDITRKLANIDENNPDRDNFVIQEINRYFLDLGMWDNAISNFLNSDFGKKLSNERLEQYQAPPFGRKALLSTINELYSKGIQDHNELIVNELYLANRMAKVPSIIMDRMGWSKEKREKLANAYTMHLGHSHGWNFLDLVEYVQEKGEAKRIVKDTYYEHFLEQDLEKIKGQLRADFTPLEFYLFAKLNYCESFFYKIKIEKLMEVLKDTKVSDYSAFDQKKDKNLVLLKIDLPGYLHPFLIHMKKNQFRRVTGKDISDFKLKKERRKFPAFPILNFKITEEQAEVLRKLQKTWDMDPIYRYSIRSLKNLRRKLNRESKEKNFEIEDTVEEQTQLLNEEKNSLTNVEEQDSFKSPEEQSSEDLKKGLTNEEINKRMIRYFRSILSSESSEISVPREYEERLTYISDTTTIPLSKVYLKIEGFLREKFKREKREFTSEELEKEVANMYIYMKICKKGFWNCVYDKENKILQSSYAKCKENLPVVIEAITSGVRLEDINKYISSCKKKMVSQGKVDGTKRKYTKRKVKKIEVELPATSEEEMEEEECTQQEKNSKLESILGLQDTLIALQNELLKLYPIMVRLKKTVPGKEKELVEKTAGTSEKIKGEIVELDKLITSIEEKKEGKDVTDE